jgi:hypothetical protein
MSLLRQAEAPGDDTDGGHAERPPEDPDAAGKLVRRLIADFEAAMELPFVPPEKADLLTFADVLRYFHQNYPSDPRVSAGALLSTRHPKGRLIFQVYLTEDEHICLSPSGTPCGRRLLVRKLDGELTERFGGKDLLTFQ